MRLRITTAHALHRMWSIKVRYSRKQFIQLAVEGILAAAAGPSLAGCAARHHDKPVIYTSFFPVYDLVKQVAQDSAEVHSFMPPNKDPHVWEPTPRGLRDLSTADLLVVNGANMEHWVDQVRDNLPNLPVLTLSDSIDLITYRGAAAMGEFQYMARLGVGSGTYGFEFGHTHQDIMRVAFFKAEEKKPLGDVVKQGRTIMQQKGEVVAQHSTISVEDSKVYALEMGHESGYIGFTLPDDGPWVLLSDRISQDLLSYRLVKGENQDEIPVKSLMEGSSSGQDKITYDPHSWISFINAKAYCAAIHDKLCELFPANKELYREGKLNTVAQLTGLGAEYKQKFKPLTRREFVVTHNAYAYLCRDLNIKHFPLQGLTSTEAPALKTVRKAVDFCRRHNVTTVFYELGASSKGADTVAGEIGGTAVPLASMEYVSTDTGAQYGGYIGIMKDNVEKIYQSLV